MTRGPLALAALASAAVPDLDPASVEGVVTDPGHPFEVAFVQDTDHRRWVVRVPSSPAAAAQLEQSAALQAILVRRLTVTVPAVKGWVELPQGGRAAVHAYLTGQLVDLEALQGGSRLAAGIGRALAHLHNLDPSLYDEAGVPSYDAQAYRTRRLAELDRAAATGRVPTGLLARWEEVLDDPERWRFTSVPTHGRLTGSAMLATPDDAEVDADFKAFLSWESAQVADPADDLAPLVAALDEDALDTVLEAYAYTRSERPDPHLLERARVAAQMAVVRAMTAAVAAEDHQQAEDHAASLRRLDDRLTREDEEREAAAEAQRIEAARAASPAAVNASTGDDTDHAASDHRASDHRAPDPGEATEPDLAESDEAVQTERPVDGGPSEGAPTTKRASASTTQPVPILGVIDDEDGDLPSPEGVTDSGEEADDEDPDDDAPSDEALTDESPTDDPPADDAATSDAAIVDASPDDASDRRGSGS